MNDSISSVRIAELEREIRCLKSENHRLKRFLEIGKLLSIERDIDKLIPLIMVETRKSVEADRSTLFLMDLDRSELMAKYAEGVEDRRIRIDLKMGLVGLCVLTKEILNITDAYDTVHFNRETDAETGYRTQSILCAPFFSADGQAVGAIELLNKRSGLFTKEDEYKISEVSRLLTCMAQGEDFRREVIEPLVVNLRKSTDSERGSVFLLDKDQKKLSSTIAEGMEGEDILVDLNLGIAGYVAVTGEEVNIQDAYTDPRFDQTTDRKTGYRTRSILCLPIKNQAGDILGVIQVLNKRHGIFTDSDLDLLRALAPQIAIAIENAILFDEQNQQSRSILEVLAASIDAKDPMTAGHSLKVAEYAAGIARELGFGESDIDILNVAALLHDYGKIGVSDSILKKPGKLTRDEYEHIKQHVKCTQNILSRMRFMRKYRNVPHIASCHHERLDGSGYGSGLKGHEIPFMSKILAVADVFEALTAERHYRCALSAEEAFRILADGIDTQFDGNIIRAMKDYWHKRSPD